MALQSSRWANECCQNRSPATTSDRDEALNNETMSEFLIIFLVKLRSGNGIF